MPMIHRGRCHNARAGRASTGAESAAQAFDLDQNATTILRLHRRQLRITFEHLPGNGAVTASPSSSLQAAAGTSPRAACRAKNPGVDRDDLTIIVASSPPPCAPGYATSSAPSAPCSAELAYAMPDPAIADRRGAQADEPPSA